MNKVLKVIIIILIVLVIIFAIAFGLGYWFIHSKISKINHVDIKPEDVEITQGVKEELATYRNIALLGIDTRDDSYSGARSDCIIIASINEKTKEVKLVSVYRDTYLELTGRSLDKVTHAYAYGGPALAMSTLNANLDLNITEFVTVNFESTKKIIESIGGIDLEIDSDEIKHIPGITSTGVHHLTGTQALAYARIRKEEGGDYKRTERMRTVLTAVFDKAKKMSVTELNTLADTILPEIYTNISTNTIISMIPEMIQYKVVDSIGWPYETRGITLDRWYGVPINLAANVTLLHKELFGKENYEPTDKVKEISQKIMDKTGYTE